MEAADPDPPITSDFTTDLAAGASPLPTRTDDMPQRESAGVTHESASVTRHFVGAALPAGDR